MPHSTIPRRGLYGELLHRVGMAILSGELRPGESLVPEVLPIGGAEVSRSVWRECMRSLAAKGLVESRQAVGTKVLPQSSWSLLDPDVLAWVGEIAPDPQLVRDLTELRRAIEPAAARMAAERATEEGLGEIERHLARMTAAVSDPHAFVEADIAFHAAVVRASGNAFVSALSGAVAGALRSSRTWVVDEYLSSDDRRSLAATLPSHREVVRAMKRGDAKGSEAASAKLVDRAMRDIDKMMRREGHR